MWTENRAVKEYQCIEAGTGRRYKKVPIHAPGTRNGESGKTWRGLSPPPGKHWQYLPGTLDEMDARGEIYWSPTGNPRRKVYLDASEGVPVQDLWLDFRDAHNQNIRITGYVAMGKKDLARIEFEKGLALPSLEKVDEITKTRGRVVLEKLDKKPLLPVFPK